MKAATGELQLTVITMLAIAAVIAFFWFMWNNFIKPAISDQWSNIADRDKQPDEGIYIIKDYVIDIK